MSRRAPKKKGVKGGGQLAGAPDGAPSALYVYCVGEAAELAPLLGADVPAAMEEEARVELVTKGDLAAAACAVPLDDYGEEALEGRLRDAVWTATRAMRHERAVEFFARRATVVPLRFGTIYLKRAGVEKMLEENRAQLMQLLTRLRGREEWGVNLYADRARLKESIAEVSPRLREMAERAAQSQPGQAYLLRKKIEALSADEVRAQIGRVAAELERELGAWSGGAARLRVLKEEAAEHGEVAAKLAFLVPRERFEGFRGAAERFAREHAAHGFRVELTGPWPAYNFATVG